MTQPGFAPCVHSVTAVMNHWHMGGEGRARGKAREPPNERYEYKRNEGSQKWIHWKDTANYSCTHDYLNNVAEASFLNY